MVEHCVFHHLGLRLISFWVTTIWAAKPGTPILSSDSHKWFDNASVTGWVCSPRPLPLTRQRLGRQRHSCKAEWKHLNTLQGRSGSGQGRQRPQSVRWGAYTLHSGWSTSLIVKVGLSDWWVHLYSHTSQCSCPFLWWGMFWAVLKFSLHPCWD